MDLIWCSRWQGWALQNLKSEIYNKLVSSSQSAASLTMTFKDFILLLI